MIPRSSRPGEMVPRSPDPLGPVADPWVSVGGDVAHPNSPRGGGGPGDSRIPGPLGVTNDPFETLPHPLAPAARDIDPILLEDKAEELDQVSQNPAPVVSKDVTKTINGISVKILADQSGVSGVSGGQTSIQMSAGDQPDVETDSKGKVSKILGKMPVITAEIGTAYGPGADPNGTSAYGRGTTDADKKKGDTSLGFHESCHRQDHQDYIQNHTLPKFDGKVGMTEQEWKDAYDKYEKAVGTYQGASDSNSFTLTDEVGNPTKSAYKKTHP